jgi:hypothetical protein
MHHLVFFTYTIQHLQFLDKVTDDIQWFEDIFMVSCKSPVCNNFLGNYPSGLHTI